MGYRIEYDRGNRKYEVKKENPHCAALIFGTLCLLILVAFHFWPEGTAMLRAMLIPGEDAVTVQAFEVMTDDLRSGASVADAVQDFCRYVIHGK